MSTDSDQPKPPVNPRPGVVKALGICNILFAVMSGLCLFVSMATMIGMMSGRGATLKAQVNASAQPTQRPAGPRRRPGPSRWLRSTRSWGWMTPRSCDSPSSNAGTGLIVNGLMFATGIGLINLRRWGARWWTALAWVKIGRLFLLWGFYIVAVAPPLSESMARSAVAMFNQQQRAARVGCPPSAN